jgi:enoyl-CoA hydratase/carnithine racemase
MPDAAAEPAPRPPDGDWLGTPYLRFERRPPFAHLTVDRPQARNALTQAMYFGLRYAVRRVDADPELAGLLITGVGDVFIPGGDLGGNVGDQWADFNAAPGAFDVLPFDTLRQSVKPVVSAVNGICQGGGLLIALCSDLAVVSERATFRVPELLRGISDTYYAQLLVRLIGPVRTRDLMFTGRRLTAAEALDWGLVSRVVPHDDLLTAATGTLGEIVQTAPHARRDIKRVLDQYVGLQDRIAFFDSLQRAESREGFAAFIEKRPPSWVPAALRRDGRA